MVEAGHRRGRSKESLLVQWRLKDRISDCSVLLPAGKCRAVCPPVSRPIEAGILSTVSLLGPSLSGRDGEGAAHSIGGSFGRC
jgi:hypothetical protein